MDIEFDFKGDPLGGVISNCELRYYENKLLMSNICSSLVNEWLMLLHVFCGVDGNSVLQM